LKSSIDKEVLMAGSLMNIEDILRVSELCIGIGIPTSLLHKFKLNGIETIMLPSRNLHWIEMAILPKSVSNLVNLEDLKNLLITRYS